ncbi:carbohydrate binding family 9 domain-containing protein [candidate division WOR-3 bacterium]|nr:carbohydrate binding family 9 domain-containing protein [candidate division WOR-3 bacterium]
MSFLFVFSIFLLPVQELAGRSVEAVFVKEPPRIDGVLDEACWQDNPGITDFVEHSPEICTEASEETRVVICYDEHNLYFGCFCYYSEPDMVTAWVVPRESSGDGDDITIRIDTYNDDRNAYVFSVNPLGNQRDIHISTMGWDYSWNGVWYAAETIEPYGCYGWFAEIAIPFKTLRFRPGDEQVWGLEVTRWMDASFETVVWADYEPEDFPGDVRVDRFGELRGIRGVKPGLHMEFMPHLTQTASFLNPAFYSYEPSRDSSVFDSLTWVRWDNGVAGLDFKWAMTSNMALDITALPDYGQISADPEIINLAHNEIYLAEHRPFFTEGCDIFSICGPFDPVYTRRIGRRLPDGSEVPIYGGIKYTGKARGTDFGIIEAYTGERAWTWFGYEDTVPPALYSVARVNQDIFSRSQIGLIATSCEQFEKGFPSSSSYLEGERVLGGDMQLTFSDDIELYASALHTFHSDTGRSGGPMFSLGGGASQGTDVGTFHFWADGNYSDSLADMNAVGYTSDPGWWEGWFYTGYDKNWGEGSLRALGIDLEGWADRRVEDTLWTVGGGPGIDITFRNNWSTSLDVYLERQYFFEDSALRWAKSVYTGFGSDPSPKVFGGLWFRLQDRYVYQNQEPQFYGHVISILPNLSWRITRNTLLYTYGAVVFTFDERWQADTANPLLWAAGSTIRYNLTPKVAFRISAQQNTQAERYSQQFLASWEFAPLSYIYLASSLNLIGDPETIDPFDVNASEFTIYGKVVYLFRI